MEMALSKGVELVNTVSNALSKSTALTTIANSGITKTISDTVKTVSNTINNAVQSNKTVASQDKGVKDKIGNVLKAGAEGVLKLYLKKKLGIGFATFNTMKDAVTSLMGGNMKNALKKATTAGINSIKTIDKDVKSVVKSVKDVAIDSVMDDTKNKIIDKQTKLVNKISDRCDKFNEAMKINDEENITKSATAIKKYMKEILPIKETIDAAEVVLNKYELWKNNGKKIISQDEAQVIDKISNIA